MSRITEATLIVIKYKCDPVEGALSTEARFVSLVSQPRWKLKNKVLKDTFLIFSWWARPDAPISYFKYPTKHFLFYFFLRAYFLERKLTWLAHWSLCNVYWQARAFRAIKKTNVTCRFSQNELTNKKRQSNMNIDLALFFVYKVTINNWVGRRLLVKR